MLTAEENERLTRIGPGTPMGDLMRRYWHPIAASAQLPTHGTKAITVLGESLVLYRDRSGQVGLVGDRCPHRRAGMVFGVPEQDGLRCAYHGWCFNAQGDCIDQPYETTEDPTSAFHEKAPIAAYPAQELGGLIFAYLGPPPAPLLPRWDLLVMDGVMRDIGYTVVPCNWLQIMENGLDPVHVEWLHIYFSNYVLEKLGRPDLKRRTITNNKGETVPQYKHKKIGFSEFEYGIIKRRVLEGTTEEDDLWAVGHPILFPNILKTGFTFQYRVPMDDVRTHYFYYTCYPPKPGVEITEQIPREIPFYDVPIAGVDGQGNPQWSLLDNNSGQDIAMWYTQGAIADRTQEKLGLSDRGIIMYRQMLRDNLRRMLEGEDPINVFRDPAENEYIEIDNEYQRMAVKTPQLNRTGHSSKYSPILKEAVKKVEGEAAVAAPVH